jgi:hypothetical protein
MDRFYAMEAWFKKHHALSLFGRIGKLRRDLDEYEYRVHWIYATLMNGGIPPDSDRDIAKETAKDLYNVDSKAVRKELQGTKDGEVRSKRRWKTDALQRKNIVAKELFPGFKPLGPKGREAKGSSSVSSGRREQLHKKDRDILKELVLL